MIVEIIKKKETKGIKEAKRNFPFYSKKVVGKSGNSRKIIPFKIKGIPSYEYERSYVEENLIAYLGNKKRLIDLILKAVQQVEAIGETKIDRNGFFVDFFAGTGVVSRLAKSLGFSVIANDWEYYSYCLNKGFLELTEEDLRLFDDEGGIEKVLKDFNNLKKIDRDKSYIARYYCPKNDLNPDVETERMFYTQKNGILIDNIRAEIDRRYPFNSCMSDDLDTLKIEKKRNLLLALLLVQASKRSNTSGVFKGFHNGFGGKKGDALSRILSPVALSVPVLSKKKNRVKVFCENALDLADYLAQSIQGSQDLWEFSGLAEIAYLDPPYNQHQYGSNYHLLNTISKNDKPPVNESFWFNGKKVKKSAIRQDWNKTASGFCYTKSAVQDFCSLVRSIKAKYILVSYSDEGIIPINEMIDILAAKGKISISTSSYVRYRGGRQSNCTIDKNIEFVLIVETALKSEKFDVDRVKKTLFSSQLDSLLKDFFPIIQFEKNEVVHLARGYKIFWREMGLELVLDHRLKLDEESIRKIKRLSLDRQRILFKCLQNLHPKTNHEKVIDLLAVLERDDSVDRKYLTSVIVRLYKKVNRKKEPILFEELTKKIVQTNNRNGFLENCQQAWKQFKRVV